MAKQLYIKESGAVPGIFYLFANDDPTAITSGTRDWCEKRLVKLIPKLELVLKGKWFDMIESGEKKEEYREIKRYWWKRIFTSPYENDDLIKLPEGGYNGRFKYVRFRRGYQKNAPEMIFKLGHQLIGKAKPGWSENEMNKVIVLQLLNRVS